jgi:hypothetical protein
MTLNIHYAIHVTIVCTVDKCKSTDGTIRRIIVTDIPTVDIMISDISAGLSIYLGHAWLSLMLLYVPVRRLSSVVFAIDRI